MPQTLRKTTKPPLLRGRDARRATAPAPFATKCLPPGPSRDGSSQREDAVTTAQEGGWLSLGLVVRNGQRPRWLQLQNAGPALACLAHAALHTPDSCHSEPSRHLPPDGIATRLDVTTRNSLPPAALVPPASSREGAWDPLGRRPPTTMGHTGPTPAPALALAPMISQARPS